MFKKTQIRPFSNKSEQTTDVLFFPFSEYSKFKQCRGLKMIGPKDNGDLKLWRPTHSQLFAFLLPFLPNFEYFPVKILPKFNAISLPIANIRRCSKQTNWGRNAENGNKYRMNVFWSYFQEKNCNCICRRLAFLRLIDLLSPIAKFRILYLIIQILHFILPTNFPSLFTSFPAQSNIVVIHSFPLLRSPHRCNYPSNFPPIIHCSFESQIPNSFKLYPRYQYCTNPQAIFTKI